MSASRISVLMVEDDPVTRRGLQLFIEQLSGIHVIGIADSGEQALPLTASLKPDVVLMDIGLPGMDGIAAVRQIKAYDRKQLVLMLTSDKSNESIFASFSAGADGYILKSSFASSLELAIRTVRCGSVWFDPQIAQMILKMVMDDPPGQNSSIHLSNQEQNLLNDLASGGCAEGVCLVQPSFIDELKRFRSCAG